MTVDQKLASLRACMKEDGIDAWVIYGSDPHQSEYVCPRYRDRAWLSGFTGSAGTIVVGAEEAILWVDSRYFIQAEEQLKNTSFTLMKLDTEGVVDYKAYLKANRHRYARIGTSAASLMVGTARLLKAEGIDLVPTRDYIDQIWADRPAVPEKAVAALDKRICGLDAEEKIALIRKTLSEKGCSATFISSLDDIAWILNLRGTDIEYNPVFLSYLCITEDQAVLFTSEKRFSNVKCPVMRLDYDKASEFIKSVFLLGDRVYINPDRTNSLIWGSFAEGVELVEGREISTDLKAAKNPVELEGMRRAHLLDGAALVNFLSRLDRSAKAEYDEISISEALEAQRRRSPEYLGPSFGPISGFAEHGAMCHYSATPESSMIVDKPSLLVLDTGGQYETGMTDVTRTLLFGKATDEQRRDYTLVLKGHLALARQVYPQGTTGQQLDALARQFLWMEGKTFLHGTGHGVGFRLNVHEGPQAISFRASASPAPLREGMVTSNEPGLYLEGRYGIRIENLVATVKKMETEFGVFLGFENLTMCPYERDLIDASMLTELEMDQIDDYHANVYDKLKGLVDKSSLEYLARATAKLARS